MKNNKVLNKNNAIVGTDTGLILYKQENNSIYIRDKINSQLIGKDRKFNGILMWLYKIREILGIDINISIKNSFERLVYVYEETRLLDSNEFKTPSLSGTLSINNEITSNVIILNRVRDIVIDSIYINNVTIFSNNLRIRVEYSENNSDWKTYNEYTFNDVESVPSTDVFEIAHLIYDHGRNTFGGQSVNGSNVILRNSPNIAITKLHHWTEDGSIQGVTYYDKKNNKIARANRNHEVINFDPPLTLEKGMIIKPDYKVDDLYLWCSGYIKDPLKTGSNVERRKRVSVHITGETYNNYYEGEIAPLRYKFNSTKRVTSGTGNIYIRYKILGTGTIATKGNNCLVINAYGRKITNEYFETVIDEDDYVYITSNGADYLNTNRSLMHKNNFYNTGNFIKNRMQSIALNITTVAGNKIQLCKEIYSDNFIDKIKLSNPPEQNFMLFEKNELITPTIAVPSKSKQLLYKKGENYINKKNINDNTKFSTFGYEAIKGVYLYNSSCIKQSKIINTNLDKINFFSKGNNVFNEVLIGYDIDSYIKDSSNEIIFEGGIQLKNNTGIDEKNIINKIKNNKTFYKGTIIIYTSINEKIKKFIKTISSGNNTPNDVYLVCTTPNDSNIDNCYFNKTKLGKQLFESKIMIAINNRIGLMYNSFENILNSIDEHISNSISLSENTTLNNLVGFNVYNFTANTIQQNNSVNRYGYYINNIINNYENSDDFNLIGTSTTNTVGDFVQYDVGSYFDAEINFEELGITDTSLLVENNDTSKSFSIIHNNNIAWRYFVGEDEIVISENNDNRSNYIIAISDENKLRLKTNNYFSSKDVGEHNITIIAKDKNAIFKSYIIDFVVDYAEAKVNKFDFLTTNTIEEIGYSGNKNIVYSRDSFFKIGISLEGEYDFENASYKLVVKNKNNPNYKMEKTLRGKWQSKIINIHFDDLRNQNNLNEKLRFGTWVCELIREKYNHQICKKELNISINLTDEANLIATPVEVDIEDNNNDGLQQGKDVYIELKFNKTNNVKTLRDFIYFCKEVRFISNSINYSKTEDSFTFLNTSSLNSVTNHESGSDLNKKTSLKWFISGTSENSSNIYLKPIANLAGDSKKTKKIKIQCLLWDDTILETSVVEIGTEGVVSTPIILGSEEHLQKLLRIEALTMNKKVEELTSEERNKVEKKRKSLSEFNYNNQQLVNNVPVFVFYSNLIEMQFDFGNAEFFSITDSNSQIEMLPVTNDGKIRFVINEDTIDSNSNGRISIRSFIKLTDGTVLSSNEKTINFIRKKKPSIVQTGDDYTKYIHYQIDNKKYYNLKTVIQSKLELDNMSDSLSTKWINHITADLVDVDKRTVIVSGPKVQFYDGFIPQRFVFDSGLSPEDINNFGDDDRIEIEDTNRYQEVEKILNDKLFSNGKYENQTFYLRFKSVEIYKDYYGENKEVHSQETFYPVKFIEELKELVITPASGIITKDDNGEENYYTYKNKVSFVLESNNTEYFMYRTDRTASFQKIFPKKVGTLYTTKITLSTYDIGNNILEVKQKAYGEMESNIYSIIVEKIELPSPPRIISELITDTNPVWTIIHTSESDKYNYSIISDGKESEIKTIKSVQYDLRIEPDNYLENGYHILKICSIDKIGNYSEDNYSMIRKIGRPTPNSIIGVEKTSEDFIEWKWESQLFEGVSKYEVEINGVDKKTINANQGGYNSFVIRHFQGKELVDGLYEIRVWSINEIGNKSYNYTNFTTRKGSRINEFGYNFYTFYEGYTNKLEANINTNDEAVVSYEYEIMSNKDGSVNSITGPLLTKSKSIPFLDKDNKKIELENGQYYFYARAINNIDEKTDYIINSFYFNKTIPSKPFVYYLKSTNNKNPLIFIKETGNEMIFSIEVKIGEHEFEKIRNNAWRPNYSLNYGMHNIVFRITDYAGNQSEYSDYIEIISTGKPLFQNDYIADMKNPVLKFDFNLEQMINFGHNNFRVEQELLGIDYIINITDANTIEIPLTIDNNIYPDGKYTFTIKLYDNLTKGYDYIVDYFAVTIDSNKPSKPFFLNNGYDKLETNKQYTKNRLPVWIWQTNDVQNLKEYIVDLEVYDEENGQYINYGNGQFNNYSTKLSGQFQTYDELKDGVYRLTVKSIGINNLESDSVVFFYVVKNNIPKPPSFDYKKQTNKKYENINKNVIWEWEDRNTGIDRLIKYKIKLNDEEFSSEFDSSITHYEEKREMKEGENTLYVIGCDKAGNWSTSSEITASQLGSEYFSFTKIIDTNPPENIDDSDVNIQIIDSKSFECFFKNDYKSEEFFLFELFAFDNEGNEVYFVKGNTLKNGVDNVYLREEKIEPGISFGELKGYDGYCEIRNNGNSETKIDNSLYFTNLSNNTYYLRIYGVDYAGNVSQPLVKIVEIEDVTSMKPVFISPTKLYTNNSTIIFKWLLDESNIKEWEYQIVTPYGNSTADIANDSKWKKISDNTFTLNNIPKIIGGIDADGSYTLYVRAVFNDAIKQEGTDLEVLKKSDVNSVTVVLDRKMPKGIYFTNKKFTTDQSVLRWTWEYTGEGDTANGVYLSFNPSLPLEEWEKIENSTEYSSFKERSDGVYTIYARTFDNAGNINDTIFQDTITLDRIPPFKPIINGGSQIFTNKIPTISWENDNNYYNYAWLILTLEEWNIFKDIYNNIKNIENYTLKNDDWGFMFSNKEEYYDENNVHEKILLLSSYFRKNDFIKENQITINASVNKYGISSEGEYVFLLTGFDQNNNWAEEFEYQFITYDITAPDISRIKFVKPQYTITNDRRPIWEWNTPNDVVKCEYFLEKNGYNDGSISGTITKPVSDESIIKYTFSPEYNLTKGEYRLVVNCYDVSGNNIQINKNVIIEDDSSELEIEYFDVFLPGLNNIISCKKNKYSSVYVIIDATIDKNSAFSYRNTREENGRFKIYEFGKTELSVDEEYEFNITSYETTIK